MERQNTTDTVSRSIAPFGTTGAQSKALSDHNTQSQLDIVVDTVRDSEGR